MTAGQWRIVKCSPVLAPSHVISYIRSKFLANIPTALEVGQLVKDEYFTLFESIGAIEVRLLSPTMIILLR
jgi:hypothetical protein